MHHALRKAELTYHSRSVSGGLAPVLFSRRVGHLWAGRRRRVQPVLGHALTRGYFTPVWMLAVRIEQFASSLSKTGELLFLVVAGSPVRCLGEGSFARPSVCLADVINNPGLDQVLQSIGDCLGRVFFGCRGCRVWGSFVAERAASGTPESLSKG